MGSTATVEYLEPTSSVLLAQRLHDTVAQRLAGIACLLADGSQPPDGALDRCRCEVEAALAELREALSSVAAVTADESPSIDRSAELRALLEAFPTVELRWSWPETIELPPGGLVEKFLAEALRNIRKHACPRHVGVDVIHERGAIVIDVVNDGVGPRRASSCGVGRRLLEVEASLHGALVEFKQQRSGRWLQRLILPAAASEADTARPSSGTLSILPAGLVFCNQARPHQPSSEQANLTKGTPG